MASDTSSEQRTPPPPPAAGPRPPGPGHLRALPIVLIGVVVFVLIVAAMVWRSAVDHSPPAAVSLSRAAAGVRSVDLVGFNGRVTVAVGDGSRITASAQPVDGRRAPNLALRADSATGHLSLTCTGPGPAAGAIPCPATTYSVLVPPRVAVSLREDSGQAALIGLSGPISITASSADTTAQALRTDDFTASITSGTLDATFASAPAHIAVTVISAQASLRLPAATAYNVQQQAVSASIDVAVPRSATSAHTIQATATSGEISLVAP